MSWLQSGHHVVNFSIWWEFQYLQDSSQGMAQNVIYNSWRGTIKVLDFAYWLWLFGLIWMFFFVPSCSHFSDYTFILWPNFSADKRQAEDMESGQGDHGVPLYFSLRERSDLVRREIWVWTCVEDRDLGWPHISRNTNDGLKEIAGLSLSVLMFMEEKNLWGEDLMDRGV